MTKEEVSKSNKIQYVAMASAVFAAVTSGVNIGWSSPYLPLLLDPERSPIPTTPTEGSWCAVMPLIGCPVGALLAAYLVNILGRKNFILSLAPITLTNFLWISFATTITELMTARCILAATEGALYTVLPIYLGEMSDPSIRGLVGSSLSVAAVLGTIFINVIGPMCSITTSGLICSAIPIIHFATFIWMPESPYYYFKIGRLEEAKASLIQLRGHKDVGKELEEIEAAVKRQEGGNEDSFMDLVTVPSNRKGLMIYCILSFTNKFSGKNPLLFYTTIIFSEADGSFDAVTSVIIFSCMGLVATGLALIVIDKFGRRPLMLFSALGCALALTLAGSYFTIQTYQPDLIKYIAWLPLIALIAYNIIFSLGLSFGPTLFLSELFPTSIKAKALCVADSIGSVYGVAASKYFQATNDALGMHFPFLTFAMCSCLGAILIYFHVPETKGKTLEEIQLELIGNKN